MGINIQGRILLNQFRVEQFLANGGTGAVYRVWDLQRNTPLAMKVLNTDIAEDPVLYKSFEREAHSLRELTHPHIVAFYGLYQTMDFAFILERYIDGPTLKDVIRRMGGQPLPAWDIFTYLKALCAALGYAHSKGIVHCDVKPANVMIDRGGSVFLTDFGVARYTESTTTTLAGAGTPAYMAPEQILAHNVTPATDVYALGVTMFELMVGRRPFLGNENGTESAGATNNERIRYGHLNLNPPDPRQFNPAVPEALAQVLLKSMAKEPGERYQSTQEFFQAFCAAGQVSPEQIPERVSLPADFFPADNPSAQPAFQAAPGAAYPNFATNGTGSAPVGAPTPPAPTPGILPVAKTGKPSTLTIAMMVGAFLVVAGILAVIVSGPPASGSTATNLSRISQDTETNASISLKQPSDTPQPKLGITPSLTPTFTVIPITPTFTKSPTPAPPQPKYDLAFSSNKGGAFQIILMESSSRVTQTLSLSGYDKVYWPSLCGDKVYGEVYNGSQQWIAIWSSGVNKDAVRWQPPTGAKNLGVPRCSPNGSYVAYSDNQNSWVVKVVDLSKNKVVYSMLDDSVKGSITGYTSWSNNNQDFFSMVYLGKNSKNEFIYKVVQTTGLSANKDLPLNKTKDNKTIESAFYPMVSPDGSLITFGCRISSVTYLCLYDGRAGQSMILTSLKAKPFDGVMSNAGASAWSRDGQWIYFTSADSGSNDIYRIHPDGSGKQNMTEGWGSEEIMPATLW